MPVHLRGGEPFWFEGNSTGCLLIHGFGGTPYEMRGLGQYLSYHSRYTVYGPALAGHATHVHDWAKSTWRDWVESTFTAYRKLAARTERVFAVGLSMGGALALDLAVHEPIAGVAAVSTPIYLRHPLESWFRAFPILHHLIPFVTDTGIPDDTLDPTVRPGRPQYDRTSTRAARHLVFHLLPHVRAELGRVRQPVLLIQARGDRTIPSESMERIFEELGTTEKEMAWLERSGHLALEDYDSQRAFQLIADFISRQLPAARARGEAAA